MKKLFKITTLCALASFASSCALLDQLNQGSNGVVEPLVYLDGAPHFKVEKFLDGNLDGFAIVQDEKGKIIDSYTVKIKGDWEAKRGTIKYSYKFNRGKRDARTWLITADDAANYTAIGHDFVTPAKGRQSGNASEILYTLLQEYKGKKENIDFKDTLYLVDRNSAIVTSYMKVGKKKIGKVTISLTKLPAVKKVVMTKKTEEKNETKQ